MRHFHSLLMIFSLIPRARFLARDWPLAPEFAVRNSDNPALWIKHFRPYFLILFFSIVFSLTQTIKLRYKF